MGAFMAEDDIYITSFIDLFNLRFAPVQKEEPGDLFFGGVDEMQALQSEFQIFQTGRSFAESAKLLGLGGVNNNRAKNRWFTLLDNLKKVPSDQAGTSGDQRIVNALIDNFGKKKGKPLPCFMKAHDSRGKGPREGLRVIVIEKDKPLFYIEQTYLTISLPMKPRKQ